MRAAALAGVAAGSAWESASASVGAGGVDRAEAGGGEGAFERAATAAEFAEVGMAYVQRGDVVLKDTEHGPALGICIGTQAAFTAPETLTFLPLAECRRAWRTN